MKKLFALAVLGLVSLGSCAQKEEKREEVKQELSAEHMRNEGVDSAAAAGHTESPASPDNTTVNPAITDSTSAK